MPGVGEGGVGYRAADVCRWRGWKVIKKCVRREGAANKACVEGVCALSFFATEQQKRPPLPPHPIPPTATVNPPNPSYNPSNKARP